MHRERGVTLIIFYKFGKAGVWLILAGVIAVMTRMGLGAHLLALADHLRHHAGAWSLELAELVTRAATGRGLWVVVVALVADAAVSLVEGWALWRGHAWGSWLVIGATGSLLPFEVVALLRHPHLVRLAVLVVNAAIVAYLVRKERREIRQSAQGREP
jgi:uncharacterized membrane protein (DUF2068 family)